MGASSRPKNRGEKRKYDARMKIRMSTPTMTAPMAIWYTQGATLLDGVTEKFGVTSGGA